MVIAVLLAASTVALAWLTPRSTYGNVWEWQPGIVTAAVWLLMAVALMVVLYQIPIGDWQRAIVLGFAPYMLASVTLMNLLERRGWQVRQAGRAARLRRLRRSHTVLDARGLAAGSAGG